MDGRMSTGGKPVPGGLIDGRSLYPVRVRRGPGHLNRQRGADRISRVHISTLVIDSVCGTRAGYEIDCPGQCGARKPVFNTEEERVPQEGHGETAGDHPRSARAIIAGYCIYVVTIQFGHGSRGSATRKRVVRSVIVRFSVALRDSRSFSVLKTVLLAEDRTPGFHCAGHNRPTMGDSGRNRTEP